MRSLYLLVVACLLFNGVFTQTFSDNNPPCPGNCLDNLNGQQCFGINVGGVGVINGSYGVESVCLDLTHTYDGDLDIFIQAPGGAMVELSTDNGGGGDNMTGTCFTATAATSITAGTAPFTGNFLPEGVLGALNDGQSANGNWQLCITDDAGGDVGTINSWGITFSNSPAPPPALGCTDPIANNYDPSATVNDGSCVYNMGCMDPVANNYDPSAIMDDGSCVYNMGCTDPTANNYDPSATMNDGSCTYNTGCTNPLASNYDPSAIIDDGSCTFAPITSCGPDTYTPCYDNNDNVTVTYCPDIPGESITLAASGSVESCCDHFYVYDGVSAADPLLGQDDASGSLAGMVYTSSDPSGCITIAWTSDGSVSCASGSAYGFEIQTACNAVLGCTEPTSPNYNPLATMDDGSCLPPACAGNDEPTNTCAGAPVINNLNGFCGATDATYSATLHGNLNAAFCGSIENNSFFQFEASDPEVALKYWISGDPLACGSGIQIEVFSVTGACATGTYTSVTTCLNPSGGAGTNGTYDISGLTPGSTYYVVIDGFGGDVCDYVFQAGEGVAVFPIELVSFSGKKKSDHNLIQWTTTSEINSRFHDIYRSVNGTEYEKIARLDAAGSSQGVLNYSFKDETAPQSAFYKLKTVDLDGSYGVSNILHIEREKLEVVEVDLFPNPIQDRLGMHITWPSTDYNGEIEIVDIMGQVVQSYDVFLRNGTNSLNYDIVDIPAGVYYFKMQTRTKQLIERFVKY